MVPPVEIPRIIPLFKTATPADLEKAFLLNISEMIRLISSLQLDQGRAWRENRQQTGEFSARLRRENALTSEMSTRLEATLKNYIIFNYQQFKEFSSNPKPPPPGMYG